MKNSNLFFRSQFISKAFKFLTGLFCLLPNNKQANVMADYQLAPIDNPICGIEICNQYAILHNKTQFGSLIKQYNWKTYELFDKNNISIDNIILHYIKPYSPSALFVKNNIEQPCVIDLSKIYSWYKNLQYKISLPELNPIHDMRHCSQLEISIEEALFTFMEYLRTLEEVDGKTDDYKFIALITLLSVFVGLPSIMCCCVACIDYKNLNKTENNINLGTLETIELTQDKPKQHKHANNQQTTALLVVPKTPKKENKVLTYAYNRITESSAYPYTLMDEPIDAVPKNLLHSSMV